MKDFRSLAEASNIIENISKEASLMSKFYIEDLGADAVGKIVSYLSEFFKPLYNLKALEGHYLANVSGIRILNVRDWDAYNKTRKTSAMYVLHFDILLGGRRTLFKLEFRKDEPVKVIGDINELTVSKLIKNWHEIKANMESYCEAAIRSFNTKCKYDIDQMIKLQNQIKSFEV